VALHSASERKSPVRGAPGLAAGTALITGGGGAIAGAIARRLDARGYELVLADVDRERMEEVAGNLSRPATLIRADLATREGIRRLAATAENELPGLTLLVNNAGSIVPGDVTELEPDALESHIMVNLVAPMQLARAAGRAMCQRGRGDILGIVSMGGILALRAGAAYTASKFGLRGFRISLQSELHRHGVRVMGVFPSGVDTPMLRSEATHSSGSPLNFVSRPLTPQRVADACMKALDTSRLETYVPYGDSIAARVVGAFPWLTRRIEPAFAKVGERGRRRFLQERGLELPA